MGKLFDPSGRCNVREGFDVKPPEQHEHPGPCLRVDLGSWRARSLVSCALRMVLETCASLGAVSRTRREAAPQAGQAQGLSKSAIAANWVKGPQLSQE